ncbi:hypothetical protein HN643_04465 [Candidatus Falkowbacteria bacterium]|jgi:hypothetical protein|nr:hypothetical protein [Candidatus Falkowbacteria bacterium]MBT6574530.1 hypothetical protein [Candidatus Falkowbacteria bacterium]MBT7500893.1 hypothetical protein [Candidatus Falkowbacteria bacterium]
MDKVVEQLKDLKSVKPRKDWVKTQRELLLSQITSQSASRRQSYFINSWFLFKSMLPGSMLRFVARPVGVLSVICLFIFSTGILGVSASKGSLPGDFLYSVKLTSERVKVGFTAVGEKQAELHMQFAEERIKEIEEVVKTEPVLSIKKAKVKVAVDGLTDEMKKATETLGKVKEGNKKAQAVVDSAKKVDEKTEEISEKLKQTQEELGEDKDLVETLEQAVDATDETGVKAVEVIVDKLAGGEVTLSEKDLVDVIDSKINKAKEDIKETQEKVDEVEQSAKDAESGAVVVNQEEETEQSEETAETEEVNIDENAEDETDGEEGETEVSDEAPVEQESTGTVNEMVEELKGKQGEAEQALTDAKDLLNHGDLASALEKIQQGAEITRGTDEDVKTLNTAIEGEVQDQIDEAARIEELEDLENEEVIEIEATEEVTDEESQN